MLLEKVRPFILGNDMIAPGSLVFSAFSGGADSLVMTKVLKELREDLDFELRLIHVNHHIRGCASDEDARAAEEFAQREGLLIKIIDVDPVSYSKAHTGVSLEEAGRLLRFDAIADEVFSDDSKRPVSVAVAHHIEDLAETVIFRLSRGTGPAGFGGMKPVSYLNAKAGKIRLIRPLLESRRDEIDEEVKRSSLSPRVDETNSDEEISRNRIRKRVLPELLRINERAYEHILSASEKICAAQEYIDEEAEAILKKNEGRLLRKSLDASHPVLKEALVRLFLKSKLPKMRDVGEAQIRAIIKTAALSEGPGKETYLPGGYYSVTDYDEIRIERSGAGAEEKSAQGSIETTLISGREAEAISREITTIPRDSYTKYFDYDRIGNASVEVRTMKQGDFMVIDEKGNTALLRRILINEKVSKEKRDKVLLLATGSRVLWAAGVRDSCDARITADTKVILKAEYKEGE